MAGTLSGNSAAQRALLFLQSLIPLGSTVRIELGENSIDSNGRYLGQIFYQGQDINLEMLKSGWGVMYFIYPYDKKMLIKYSEASKMASESELGIFSTEFNQDELPYLFRQKTKGMPGSNFVADFKTKKIYSTEHIEVVPHYNRVFFSDLEIARSRGFSASWNK